MIAGTEIVFDTMQKSGDNKLQELGGIIVDGVCR